MDPVDLTPVGFTPTESAAYNELLARGPLTGYAVGKALSIARANAYQALNGLVAKGAVSETDQQPRRFRPLQPEALFALIVSRETAKLDRLETALARSRSDAAPALVHVATRRGALELALRTGAREGGLVRCLAPSDACADLNPLWHKRLADRRVTEVWSLGPLQHRLPLELAGEIPPERVAGRLGSVSVILLCAPSASLFVKLGPDSALGYWTSDELLTHLVDSAFAAITGA